VCGAWSYDNFEGVCYLHTVDSCCGQLGKRETISGKAFKMIRKEETSLKVSFCCHVTDMLEKILLTGA
jgi:hypothetical protein